MKRIIIFAFFTLFFAKLSLGQSSNPAIKNLPFTLNAWSSATTINPGPTASPNQEMAIGTENNNTDGTFNTNLGTNAPNGSVAGSWRGENASGVSYQGGGGNNYNRASFLTRINTLGYNTITVAWTVRDISVQANTNYIELQWKLPAASTWTDVTGDLYQQGVNASGSTFNVTLPNTVDNLAEVQIRWIYYEIGTNNRSRLAIDDITINGSSATPSIAITNPGVSAGNVGQATSNAIIHRINLDVTVATAILDSVGVQLGGTYQTTDLVANSMKLWYNTSATLTGATLLSTKAVVASGSTVGFNGFTQNIPSGTTGRLFVTADISPTATVGNTIRGNSTAFNAIRFQGAVTKTGNDPIGASGYQTITATTPNVALTGLGPAAGNIYAGSTSNLIYSIQLDITANITNLSQLTITTGGTYSISDLGTNPFKLYFSTDNILDQSDVVLSTVAAVASGNPLTFGSLNQALTNPTSRYLFVTVDISASASAGKIIFITATPHSGFTFTNGATKSGTNPVNAGGSQLINSLPYTIFDNFNRNNSSTLGAASSGLASWVDAESNPSCGTDALEKVRLNNNMALLSNCGNNLCGNIEAEYASIDANGLYPTTLGNATSEIYWMFNMKQSRPDPSGFTSNNYGVAFIIGATESTLTNSTVKGYAVIYGESGTNDSVRLVALNNGLSNFTSIIAQPFAFTKSNYMSIKVAFNACTNTWKLWVRNDGSSAFSDPATITGLPAVATNSTYTNQTLRYLGPYFNHSSGCSETALFDNLYIPSASSFTTAYTWTGAVNNDYQTSLNWAPERSCPNITDLLTFNTGGTINVINIPTQTIRGVVVTNSTTLSLAAQTGATRTLTMLNSVDNSDELVVNAGASLTINADDALQLTLGNGATATINGSFTFNNTVTNNARAHRLTVGTGGQIVFASGSTCTTQLLTGNPFGTDVNSGTVVFQNGAKYYNRSGSNPFGLTAPSAIAQFQSGSYFYQESAVVPSLGGRTYGNLVFNTPLTLTLNSGATSPCTIQDSLIFNQNTVIVTASLNNQPVTFNIGKHVKVNAGANLQYNSSVLNVINFNNPSNCNNCNYQLEVLGTLTTSNGNFILKNNVGNATLSLPQNISLGSVLNNSTLVFASNGNYTLLGTLNGSGSIQANKSKLTLLGSGNDSLKLASGNDTMAVLTLNKASGSMILSSNITIRDSLLLSSGIFIPGTYSVVLPGYANNVIPTASNSSYIEADYNSNVAITPAVGVTAHFPTGLLGTYNPLWITNNGTQDRFTVKINPYLSHTVDTSGTPGDSSQTLNREWNITEDVPGGTNATVTFGWHTSNERANFVRTTSLHVGHWTTVLGQNNNQPFWQRLIATLGGTTPYFNATVNNITSFSPYAVGSLAGLPVDLLNFTGKYVQNQAQLNWATASEKNASHFDVQYLNNENVYQTLGTVYANGNSANVNQYQYLDQTLTNGSRYYRLKMVDVDGSVKYSNVIYVKAIDTKAAIQIAPNPFTEQFQLQYNGSIAIYSIFNIQGQMVASGTLTNGFNTVSPLIAPGIYVLKITNAAETNTFNLIKTN